MVLFRNMLSIQHKKNYLEQKTTTTNKQEINLQEANTPYIKIHTKLDLKNLSFEYFHYGSRASVSQ